ncbi:MAG: PilN domain-containing protein [Myxococcota bacterium]
MIEINLLPVREAKRKENVRELVAQTLLVMLISGGSLGLVHSRLVEQRSLAAVRVAQMENDIENFKPQLAQVAAFRSRKSKLEQKIGVIAGLERARTGPVRMFDELATRTPERLWITSLDTEGDKIVFKGESLDNSIVAEFLRELKDSPFFEDVGLESTEMGKKKKGIKLVTFNISASTASPPDAAAEASADKAG